MAKILLNKGDNADLALKTLDTAEPYYNTEEKALVIGNESGGKTEIKPITDISQLDNAGEDPYQKQSDIVNATANLAAKVDMDMLTNRVGSLENLGHYAGTFDSMTNDLNQISAFPNGVTLNDFINIRDTNSRYIAKTIDEEGNITWVYDITFSTDVTGKADKVSSAVDGNLAGLDAAGNLTDIGKKPADFIDTSDSEQVSAGSKAFRELRIRGNSTEDEYWNASGIRLKNIFGYPDFDGGFTVGANRAAGNIVTNFHKVISFESDSDVYFRGTVLATVESFEIQSNYIGFGYNRLQNIALPVDSNDAVTKIYVDESQAYKKLPGGTWTQDKNVTGIDIPNKKFNALSDLSNTLFSDGIVSIELNTSEGHSLSNVMVENPEAQVHILGISGNDVCNISNVQCTFVCEGYFNTLNFKNCCDARFTLGNFGCNTINFNSSKALFAIMFAGGINVNETSKVVFVTGAINGNVRVDGTMQINNNSGFDATNMTLSGNGSIVDLRKSSYNTEFLTGTFIDGQPVYGKRLTSTTNANSGDMLEIGRINRIVYFNGTVVSDTESAHLPIPLQYSGGRFNDNPIYSFPIGDAGNIYIVTWCIASYTYEIEVHYTKKA